MHNFFSWPHPHPFRPCFPTRRAQHGVFPSREPLSRDETYHIPRKPKDGSGFSSQRPSHFLPRLFPHQPLICTETCLAHALSPASYVHACMRACVHITSCPQGTYHPKNRDSNLLTSALPSMAGTGWLTRRIFKLNWFGNSERQRRD